MAEFLTSWSSFKHIFLRSWLSSKQILLFLQIINQRPSAVWTLPLQRAFEHCCSSSRVSNLKCYFPTQFINLILTDKLWTHCWCWHKHGREAALLLWSVMKQPAELLQFIVLDVTRTLQALPWSIGNFSQNEATNCTCHQENWSLNTLNQIENNPIIQQLVKLTVEDR